MSESASRDRGPEAIADFLRGLRRRGRARASTRCVAAQRAAAGLPRRLRDGGRGASSRRMQGDYHEDEWGFDEEFAEAVFPLFEFLYGAWWRVEAEGAAQRPRARAGADRRQPRRLAVPLRRDDDHRRRS